MTDSLTDRIVAAFNVFRYGIPQRPVGTTYSYNPVSPRFIFGAERSIIAAIYNRIGIDVASVPIRHVRVDEDGNFLNFIKSRLDNCLILDANVDQTGRAFMQDIVMSLCDEGSVAVVPVDTTVNPESGAFDVISMRVARIEQWHPDHVTVDIYNQETGSKQLLTVSKKACAIIENPLYAVMNEPNSVLRRLIEKLNLLDAVDQQSGSGKLDLILQLPYAVKSPARKELAVARKQDMVDQLENSKYGVAYIDTTEKITQLNRPVTNNLMEQVEYLTRMLYSQLGLTEEVFNGTADEKTMLNYWNRTIEPFLAAITDSMARVLISKTARSQGQRISYIRDPFRLVQAETLAELADKLTRNEILTSNEFRGILGKRPSSDPGADELRNKNLNKSDNITKPESSEMEDEVHDESP